MDGLLEREVRPQTPVRRHPVQDVPAVGSERAALTPRTRAGDGHDAILCLTRGRAARASRYASGMVLGIPWHEAHRHHRASSCSTAAFVFSLVMTRRLISTWHPEPTRRPLRRCRSGRIAVGVTRTTASGARCSRGRGRTSPPGRAGRGRRCRGRCAPTSIALPRMPSDGRSSVKSDVSSTTAPRTKFGAVVVAVARMLVPNCSAAIVTKIAQ